jgi:putative phosphoesterase
MVDLPRSGICPSSRKRRRLPRRHRAEDLRTVLEQQLSPLAIVLADTHIPRRARALPGELIPYLKEADLILHAGDLVEPSLLEELALYASIRAVKGNVDGSEVDLPETQELDFDCVNIAMIHDSGRKEGRRNRLKKRFPKARVIVFGHSHIPFVEDEDGLLLLNPGSPTDKRRQPHHTFALLHTREGEVQAEILPLYI